MTKKAINALMSIGIDIGKDTFHLVGFDYDGQLVLRKKIKRLALLQTFETLPRCVVGMEACLSAHFVSRSLAQTRVQTSYHPCHLCKALHQGTEE